MMNILKRIDKFILDINTKDFILFLLSQLFMLGYIFFTLKYQIKGWDNFIMTLSLVLSITFWNGFIIRKSNIGE